MARSGYRVADRSTGYVWLVGGVLANLLIIATPFVLVGVWHIGVVSDNLEMIVSALTGLSTTVWAAGAAYRGLDAWATVLANRTSDATVVAVEAPEPRSHATNSLEPEDAAGPQR